MKHRNALLALLCASLFFLSTFAQAQVTSSKKGKVTVIQGKDRTIVKKRTEYTFDGLRTDGTLHGPQIRSISVVKPKGFNSLIRYRSGFHKEMWKAARNM